MSSATDSSTVSQVPLRHNAVVKAVISGDTLVLVGKANAAASGPPKEITITIASLVAPSISRGPRQATEEPFAWESREFLRKFSVGKNVTFSILYVVSSINRTFGEVFLVGPDGESTSVAKVIAAAGWATVKDSRDASRLCSDHSELGPLEAAAKVAKQGMFANPKSAITRNINWNPNTAALEDLLQKAQAQTTNPGVVRVVIEGVRDGATLRVCVIGPGNTFIYASLFMAGVMCPRAGSGSAAGSGATGGAGASAAAASASENEGGDDENDEAPAAAVSSSSGSSAEPYGLQAKVFSELRLLNRELDVKLFAVDARANALVGTVLHPKGDIAGEILKNGLGKLAERTVTYVSKENALALRQAEFEAKNAKRFLWSDEAASGSAGSSAPAARVIDGVCVEILSGDTLVLLVSGDTEPSSGLAGTEVKISLASVRAPRLAPPNASTRKDATPSEPWAVESRDWVRSKAIGKTLRVTVDYEKYQSAGGAAGGAASDKSLNLRLYGTVRLVNGSSVSSTSLSMALIGEGLATCLKYRNRDEPRSAEYDALLVEEASAAVKNKGVHSNHVPSEAKFTDYATDGKRAKAFLSLLQTKKSYRGVVEFVYSGSRVKVRVPSESAIFQFSLSQVRCPLAGRTAGSAVREAEPFSEDAKAFTRRHLLQRDVEFVIDSVDKNGIALGRIYAVVYAGPNTQRSKRGAPYAPLLLQAGLARVDRYAEDGDSDGDSVTQLQASQDLAKLGKLGLWSLPEPEIVNNEEDEDGEADGEAAAASAAASGSGSSNNPWVVGASVNVRLSEIVDVSSCYLNVRQAAGGVDQLSVVTDAVTELVPVLSALQEPVGVQRGSLVAVKFEEKVRDGDSSNSSVNSYWCRGVVNNINKGTAEVFYVDYGDSQSVPVSSLIALEAPAGHNLPSDSAPLLQLVKSTPALAVRAQLAFLKPPTRALDASLLDSEGNSLSYRGGCTFNELAWGKDLTAVVVAVQRNRDRDRDDRSNRRGGKGGAAEKDHKEKEAGLASRWTNHNLTVHVVLYHTAALNAPTPSTTPAPESEEGDLGAPFNRFESVPSINELIADRGLALLSREYTKFIANNGSLGFNFRDNGGASARGRRGEMGNFLLTSSSAPSNVFAGNDAAGSSVTAVVYMRLHAAFTRAYHAHVGVFRYGDPGDSDDEGDSAPVSSSSAGAGAATTKDSSKPQGKKAGK